MAQLNCPTCHHGVFDPWNQMNETCGSNLSLNVTPGYPMNPMWMGTWHGPSPSSMGMYPYPMSMPPPVPHVHSSRPSSPTHSIKSRKSHLSKKSNRRRHESDSDIEDDIDDIEERRSIFSQTDRKSNRLIDRPKLRDTASMPREIPRELPRRASTLDRVERLSVSRNHHRKLKSSTSQDSDDEIVEDEKKPIQTEKEEPLKPVVITVPKTSWECEHCTFVNEPGTRVCVICCKTPTSKAKLINHVDNQSKPTAKPKRNDTTTTRRARRSISKESSSEIEAITNKIDKLINNKKIDDWNELRNEENRKEGRNRKITFWPGTKFTPLQQ